MACMQVPSWNWRGRQQADPASFRNEYLKGQRLLALYLAQVPRAMPGTSMELRKIFAEPKCPSTEEWIKKVWYIYTMECYWAIKRNGTGSFAETWVDLETVTQSEISQKEKNKYIWMHIFESEKNWSRWSYLQNRNRNTDVEEKNVWLPRGKVGVEWTGRLRLMYIHNWYYA